MQAKLTKISRTFGLLVGVLFWIGATGAVLADVHPLRVVSQTCGAQSCQRTTAYGSAVSIGRTSVGQEIFLTAAHCTQGAAPRIEIGIQGQWHLAAILARAENHADIALLSLNFTGTQINAAPIAKAAAEVGTEVSLTGFPQGGPFRKRTGTVIPGRFADYDLVINQPSLPGESGGGVFNPDGELVGIISATAPAESPTLTLAVGVTRIRQLLNQAFPATPRSRSFCPPSLPANDPSAEIVELRRELDQLRTRLAAMESQAAMPTEPDPALLRRIERLEQLEIPVQILTPEGEILDEARYRLGQPLQFRLIAKPEGEKGR